MPTELAVRDATDTDFEEIVVARSRHVPVVVDFWAPWCGPCRVLGPLLEREIAALDGRVELVKVNTDTNPELARRFDIQGIPALKAFTGGQVTKEMAGLQPAEALRRWLEELAPNPVRQALDAAREKARARDFAGAEQALRALLAQPQAGTPTHAAMQAQAEVDVREGAAIALAGVLLDQRRPDDAERELLHVGERSRHDEAADAVRRRIQFARDAAAFGGRDAAAAALTRDPGDLEARFALASAQAADLAWEDALANLLEIVKRSRKFREDGARRAMLAIFQHLGPDDPLVPDYRRQLQVVT